MDQANAIDILGYLNSAPETNVIVTSIHDDLHLTRAECLSALEFLGDAHLVRFSDSDHVQLTPFGRKLGQSILGQQQELWAGVQALNESDPTLGHVMAILTQMIEGVRTSVDAAHESLRREVTTKLDQVWSGIHGNGHTGLKQQVMTNRFLIFVVATLVVALQVLG